MNQPPAADTRAETDEAGAVDAEAEADADGADDDPGITDASVAQYLPALGEGEPIEEAPVRPGRSFCERQCMWIAQAWYRATEDSERGTNMTAVTFQKNVAVLYNKFRLEFIEETVLAGGLSRDQLVTLYKERPSKFIYNKWLTVQRSVLDFIAYVKTRGQRPSGYSTDDDWMKVLRSSFVDLKNARSQAAGRRDKFNCPGLLNLHDFLM